MLSSGISLEPLDFSYLTCCAATESLQRFWAAGCFPSTIRNFDLQYKALPIREVMHYRSRLHLFQNRKELLFINLDNLLWSTENLIVPIAVRLI